MTGQLDMACGPIEQTKTQLIFQLPYQHAQPGGRDEESFCRPRETLMPGCKQEGPKLARGKVDC